MRDILGHGTITKFIFSGLYIMKEKYIQLIDEALKNSFQYKSKLCDDIYAIEGMSGKMTRCFYNNLC